MARDRLESVLTIRKRAVDGFRRDLAVCAASESAVEARIAALDDSVRRDRAAHVTLDDAHRFQDMFAERRLAREAERAAAMRALDEARARSAEVRAELVAARVAAEAVGAVIAERAAARAAGQARRAQSDLEEAARFGKRLIASAV